MQNSCYAQIVSNMLTLFLIYQLPGKVLPFWKQTFKQSWHCPWSLATLWRTSLHTWPEFALLRWKGHASDGQASSQVDHSELCPPNSEIFQHCNFETFKAPIYSFQEASRGCQSAKQGSTPRKSTESGEWFGAEGQRESLGAAHGAKRAQVRWPWASRGRMMK